MSKVNALRSKDITPTVVVHSVAEEAENLTDLFVVGFDKQGQHIAWSSGDRRNMALAALILQDLAMADTYGVVETEQDDCS